MKTIFDRTTTEQLITRAKNINNNSKPQWGKMNAYQMLVHCNKNMELLQSKRTYPRLFMGRIFGKLALKSTLKNDKPMSKNSPTHPDLVIKKQGNVEDIRAQFINNLTDYLNRKPSDYKHFIHPFFGKMTIEQVGQWEYKHIDHHLRQFGA